MVQIKEYTQREGLQPVNRGALNIQKPRIMAEGKGLELSEKPLDTAYQLAKLGVEMKERRDDAMVSEFANQYAIEEAKQINDFKQNYQGLNAYKIMDKYNEWRDDYLAKYSSYDNNSDDDNEHVYLENAEQINKMKNSLARSHVSTINSLSNYIGSQEESARKNALTASIQGYVEKISLEDIPENIELYGENIRGSLAALYKGQSEEFINQKAKSMMNAAVSANLMNVAAQNPEEAIALFENPIYADNMTDKTKKTAKDTIQKMYATWLSNKMAEQMAAENKGTPEDNALQEEGAAVIVDAATKGKFFDNVSRADYNDKIKKDAVAKRDKIIKNVIDTQSKIQNDALLDSISLTKNEETGQAEISSVSVDTLNNIASTYKGSETLMLLNTIDARTAHKEQLIKDGKDIAAPTEKEDETLRNVLSNIRRGKYKVIGDMAADLSNLTVDYQTEAVAQFMEEYNYNKQTSIAKKKHGLDVDKQIKSNFYTDSGLKDDVVPAVYNAYKEEAIDRLQKMLLGGQELTPELVQKASSDAWNYMYNGDDNSLMAYRLMYNTGLAAKKDNSKTIKDRQYYLDLAKKEAESMFGDDINDDTASALARYIVDKDSDLLGVRIGQIKELAARRPRYSWNLFDAMFDSGLGVMWKNVRKSFNE